MDAEEEKNESLEHNEYFLIAEDILKEESDYFRRVIGGPFKGGGEEEEEGVFRFTDIEILSSFSTTGLLFRHSAPSRIQYIPEARTLYEKYAAHVSAHDTSSLDSTGFRRIRSVLWLRDRRR